jgi:serine phosphatase RsbU (regulator of sigma subunit)
MLSAADGAGPERLFDVVNHMNLGRALLKSHAERAELSRMNALAGQRAKKSAAYGVAAEYLETSLALLSSEEWASSAELYFECSRARVECVLLAGGVERASALSGELLGRAHDKVSAGVAFELSALILDHEGRLPEEIATLRRGLQLLDVILPEDPGEIERRIGEGIGKMQAHLGRTRVEDLVHLPDLVDPEKLATMKLLHRLVIPALQVHPPTFVLAELVMFDLALTCGTSAESCKNFVDCGLIQAGMLGDYDTAYRLGKAAFALLERYAPTPMEAGINHVFGTFISHWRAPYQESLDALDRGERVGLEMGDLQTVMYVQVFRLEQMLWLGRSLDECHARAEAALAYLSEVKAVNPMAAVGLTHRLVTQLREPSEDPRIARESADVIIAMLQEIGNTDWRYWYGQGQAMVTYLLGDIEAAAEWSASCTSRVSPGCALALSFPDHHLFHALILAKKWRREPEAGRPALLAAMGESMAKLKTWAETNPENFMHKYKLCAAEMARLSGAPMEEVLRLYEEALSTVGEGLTHMRALANELQAEFWLEKQQKHLARHLLQEAHYLYQRWGARSKLRQLALAYPEWLGRASSSQGASDPLSTVFGAAGGNDSLDVASIIKASQAASTEIVLSKLIASLMRIVIQQAGAERGYLMLLHGGELWVEGAAGTADHLPAGVSGAEPDRFERFRLDWGAERARALLPQSILDYVQRTRERVLVTSAEERRMFAADPYLTAAPPRSLLCLPMIRQGALVGLLYLENSLTSDAFSPDRVGLLEVVSSQAAISLENAALYEKMEQRVQDRTRELEASTRELEASLCLLKERQAQLIQAERKAAVAHYEREMAIAQQIQTSILPRRIDVPGLEVAASMVTASEVGGDYYDLLPTDDGGCWMGIGDVSGHGLNAGLVMLMIQSGLATLMRRDAYGSPAELLALLNQMLYENIRVRLARDDFATLSLYRFYPDGRFVVAGAHEVTLIWRGRTGQCEELGTVGSWVGAVRRVERYMKDQEGRLDPGDLMALYTDGITEAQGPSHEQFGLARFVEALSGAHAEPCEAICGRILDRVSAWSAEQEDDRTLVVIRRSPC